MSTTDSTPERLVRIETKLDIALANQAAHEQRLTTAESKLERIPRLEEKLGDYEKANEGQANDIKDLQTWRSKILVAIALVSGLGGGAAGGVSGVLSRIIGN